MKIKLASNYGFCFGVKRAIKIAEDYKNSSTMGPLIHNQDEINRLQNDFNVGLYTKLSDVKDNDTVIIRTHGIPKDDLKNLRLQKAKIINATCPFVTTPQQIVKKMSKEGYSILIFGDAEHPVAQRTGERPHQRERARTGHAPQSRRGPAAGAADAGKKTGRIRWHQRRGQPDGGSATGRARRPGRSCFGSQPQQLPWRCGCHLAGRRLWQEQGHRLCARPVWPR